MNISKNKTIIAAIALVGIGYGAAYFSKPDKIVTVERVVVKEVLVKEVKKDVVKTIVKSPDGTVTETVTDKSVTNSNNSKDSLTDKSNITTNKAPGVRVSVLKLVASQNDYSLALHSPPLLNVFKMQVGLAGSIDTKLNSSVGVYVQF